jgi:hypothetical protein
VPNWVRERVESASSEILAKKTLSSVFDKTDRRWICLQDFGVLIVGLFAFGIGTTMALF